MAHKSNEKTKPSFGGLDFGIGGILKGLGDLVEKLEEVSESGETASETGEIRGDGGQLKGIYGFTVKVGLGGDKPKVEPFGNLRKDAKSGHTVVQETREPLVDVFEEEDHILVVAEMAGIAAGDVSIEVNDDLLTIVAARGDKKYRKEVLLPASIPRERMEWSCNNGVLEIKCLKGAA
jgi:HSP20 family protein